METHENTNTKGIKMLQKAVEFKQRYRKSHVDEIPMAADVRNKQ